MPALLGLLGASWRPLAILAVLGTVALGATVLIHERNAARAHAAALETDLAAARASVAACQGAVAQQNAAVAALRAAA
ncbi:MAG TPA: hypothetical protein VNF29_11395, partial [Candidatus Binataceae bacterium]|nr:hypothetical protein [Candidatus Binataceae bacterium]